MVLRPPGWRAVLVVLLACSPAATQTPAGVFWNPGGDPNVGGEVLICGDAVQTTRLHVLLGEPCETQTNYVTLEDKDDCGRKVRALARQRGTVLATDDPQDIPPARAMQFPRGCWLRIAGADLPPPPPTAEPTAVPETAVPTPAPTTAAPTPEPTASPSTSAPPTAVPTDMPTTPAPATPAPETPAPTEPEGDSLSTIVSGGATAAGILSGSALSSTQGGKLKQFMKLARCPPDTDSQDLDFLDSPTGMGRARNSGTGSSSLSNRRTMMFGNLLFLAGMILTHIVLVCIHYLGFKLFCNKKNYTSVVRTTPREEGLLVKSDKALLSSVLSDTASTQARQLSTSCVSEASDSTRKAIRRRGYSVSSRASGRNNNIAPPRKRGSRRNTITGPIPSGVQSSFDDDLPMYRIPSGALSESDFGEITPTVSKRKMQASTGGESSPLDDSPPVFPSRQSNFGGRSGRSLQRESSNPLNPSSPLCADLSTVLVDPMFPTPGTPHAGKRSDNMQEVAEARVAAGSSEHTFAHSLAVMRFPSFSVFPFLILFQPISTPAFVLLYYVHTLEDILSALFGLAVLLVITVLMGRQLTNDRFKPECELVAEEGRGKVAGWLLGTHSWSSIRTENTFERRHALVFKDFLYPYRWFLLVDILLLSSISAIGAIIPASTSQCAVQAVIMTVLEALFAIYVFCNSPFLARLDHWNVLLITGLQIVGLGMALATILTEDQDAKDSFAQMSRGFLLASTVALLLKSLFDLIVFIRDRISSCTQRKQQQRLSVSIDDGGTTTPLIAPETPRAASDVSSAHPVPPLMIGGTTGVSPPETHETKTEPACTPRLPVDDEGEEERQATRSASPSSSSDDDGEVSGGEAGPSSEQGVTPARLRSLSGVSSLDVSEFNSTRPQAAPYPLPKSPSKQSVWARRVQSEHAPLPLVYAAASAVPRPSSTPTRTGSRQPPPRGAEGAVGGLPKSPTSGRGGSVPPPISNLRRYSRNQTPTGPGAIEQQIY